MGRAVFVGLISRLKLLIIDSHQKSPRGQAIKKNDESGKIEGCGEIREKREGADEEITEYWKR